ncbi:MAG: hypothetical protein OSB00_16760 [Sphingomonas bacterium]|nr:hypothetical protein [Sphingomonas bacterium]
MSVINTIRHTATTVVFVASIAAGTAASADTRGTIAKLDPTSGAYCVKSLITGSIIPRDICGTRDEWIEMGASIVPKAQQSNGTETSLQAAIEPLTRPQTRP